MTEELAAEQRYVDEVYERLQELRARAGVLAREASIRDEDRVADSLFERDVAAAQAARRLATLDVPKGRMAVGRLDLDDGDRIYVGRLAIADEAGDPLLVDWRAPIAAAFYQAVPGDPMGVVRRRHFRWRGDSLVGLDDEVLDAESAVRDGLALVGEGALVAALAAPRTGRMTDVVATIQAEQDRVIRRPRPGVLVVQGAPGTGKTAVALHRAAYLLYAEHASLRGQAILFVGPNATFLRYVEEVVPSLGEDRVVLATPAELGPDVPIGRPDGDDAARLKGDPRMAAVLAKAVADRERVPKREVTVPCGRFVLRIDHDDLRRLVARNRRSAGPHNARRRHVERGVLGLLQQALDGRLRRDVEGSMSDRRPVEELVDRRHVTDLVDSVWPLLTPERLLRFLYGAPRRLVRAGLTEDEAQLLQRPDDGDERWSEADVALLDELDVLLGPLPERRRPKGRRPIDPMVDRVLADLVPDCPVCGAELSFVTTGGEPGGDRLRCDRCERSFRAGDVIGDAAAHHLRGVHDSLVERNTELAPSAGRPGDAAYGHVVVDEAQDLSAMQWRAVARRCPALSLTIAGDRGQAIRPGGTGSWEAAADALGATTFELVELTVNYRAPAEVMAAATAVLREAGIETTETRSVRSTGPPCVRDVDGAIGPDDVRLALEEAAGAGTTVVIAPEAMLADLAGLDAEVLGVLEAKGLEFDAVVVVDPDAIAAEGEGGARRTYVAMTRTTDRLHVLRRRQP